MVLKRVDVTVMIDKIFEPSRNVPRVQNVSGSIWEDVSDQLPSMSSILPLRSFMHPLQ